MNGLGLEKLLSTEFEVNIRKYYNGEIIEKVGHCGHRVGSVNGCCFDCGVKVC